jgi:glycosyltransferase involved in cell wall biosynthesis
MTIEIAVPTYNAAAWLDDFLVSVESQSVANWRIIARDDNSRDDTPSMLESWQRRFGERMTILRDGAGNLG